MRWRRRPMPDLPSGTVTLLFTDIAGSTRLLQRLGERYAGVLAEHHRLLRAAWAAHGGREVSTQGDAFFVAFPRAIDAVQAAVAAQRELALLRERLVTALAGRGSLVLLGGEAGIGKTTLAEATGREALELGARVAVGRCYDLAETPPYGPWREVLASIPTLPEFPRLPAALDAMGQGAVVA